MNFVPLNKILLVEREMSPASPKGIVVPSTYAEPKRGEFVRGRVVKVASDLERKDINADMVVYFLVESAEKITLDGKNYYVVEEAHLVGFSEV